MIDPLAAFYARAASDPELVTLLGAKPSGAARLFPGWPPDPWTESDFPRATYFAAVDVRQRPGHADVQLQTDSWVWPSGAQGGLSRVIAIDERLLALFDEQVWEYDDQRLYARAGVARDYPAAPNEPLRRLRMFAVSVN